MFGYGWLSYSTRIQSHTESVSRIGQLENTHLHLVGGIHFVKNIHLNLFLLDRSEKSKFLGPVAENLGNNFFAVLSVSGHSDNFVF